MIYLSNSFSLQMLSSESESICRITPVSAFYVSTQDFVSCVGHSDTATVVSNILGKEVVCNRTNVSLKYGDTLLVAQVRGGRLPEGATTLPEGVEIVFMEVELL